MKKLISIALLLSVVACTTTGPIKDERMKVSGHLDEPLPAKPAIKRDIPPVVNQVPIVEAPKPAEKLQTFTVVATNLPANELLFALARDARLNLDIDPAIEGNVSINAIDQTLPQILKRISRQVELRYYLDGPNLVVERNLPYTRIYRVDYLNMERSADSTVSISTEIAATGTSLAGDGGGSDSSTNISNKSKNDFWKSLDENLTALASTNDVEGTVIINRESGTISVTTTAANHEAIQDFIDRVMSSVRKQVLIEATVVEVTLNDDYQSGVDWSRILADGEDGWSLQQSVLGSSLSATPFLSATYSNSNNERDISAAIKALDSFGDVSVMSSPKIMAINNQTSILKVVDNVVYFTTEIEDEEDEDTNDRTVTITNTVYTVPVGFVMNVTPFITDNDEIILNIRPTISRILQFVDAPTLERAGFELTNISRIPEVQVREMESVLRVADGDTAVIGGLMEDSINENSAGLPGLHDVDGWGFFFGTDERKSTKTELVIFLRPRIIDQASLNGDLVDFKRFLRPKLLQDQADNQDTVETAQ